MAVSSLMKPSCSPGARPGAASFQTEGAFHCCLSSLLPALSRCQQLCFMGTASDGSSPRGNGPACRHGEPAGDFLMENAALGSSLCIVIY